MPLEIPPNGATTPTTPSLNQTSSEQTSSEQSQPNNQVSQEPAPEVTAANALEEFANYTGDTSSVRDDPAQSGQPSPAQSQQSTPTQSNQQFPHQRPPRAILNSKRKFDGLADDEKVLFDQMSNQAYERIYPQYIKSKQMETEIASLREQNKQLQDVSFYDQEGAYKISPEYEQLQTAASTVDWEQNHWQRELATANKVLRQLDNPNLTEEQQAKLAQTTVKLLTDYDQRGNPVFQNVPVTDEIATLITKQLNQAVVLSNDYRNRLGGLQNTFKEKHTNYTKNLDDVKGKLFQGFDMTRMSPLVDKKLSEFPAYTRNKPEVKLLAQGWVLVDALIALLNKNRNNNTSQQMRNGIAANSGMRASGAGAGNGEPTVQDTIKDFQKAGYLGT